MVLKRTWLFGGLLWKLIYISKIKPSIYEIYFFLVSLVHHTLRHQVKLVIIKRGFSLSQLLKNSSNITALCSNKKKTCRFFFSSPKYEPGYFSSEIVHQKSPVECDPRPLERTGALPSASARARERSPFCSERKGASYLQTVTKKGVITQISMTRTEAVWSPRSWVGRRRCGRCVSTGKVQVGKKPDGCTSVCSALPGKGKAGKETCFVSLLCRHYPRVQAARWKMTALGCPAPGATVLPHAPSQSLPAAGTSPRARVPAKLPSHGAASHGHITREISFPWKKKEYIRHKVLQSYTHVQTHTSANCCHKENYFWLMGKES